MYEDLVVRLQRRGIASRVSNTTLWVCCPYCVARGTSKDTKYRLGIELKGRTTGRGYIPKGSAHCFNCGFPKGWNFDRTQDTLQQLLGTDFTVLVEDNTPESKVPEAALPEDFQLLAGSKDYWARRAWTYLSLRNMTQDQVHEHEVGVSMFVGRVIFPIKEEGQLMGWSGRTIVEAEPKWLHSIGLIAPYWARKSGKSSVVITEGIFDALAIERVLDSVDVLALLGTNLTQYKADQISSYENAVLWLDPDIAGRSASVNLATRLYENGCQVQVVVIEPKAGDKLDPGSLSSIEIEKAYWNRQTWSRRLGLKLLYYQDN